MTARLTSAVSLVAALTSGAALAAAPVNAKALFQTRCATCHGVAGDGQGIAAYLLNPKPRDLTKGTFRLRSTPTGTLPTDDDLLRTITNGIPGTAMPPATDLPEADRRALVAHVKSLAPAFKEDGQGTPVAVGAPPASSAERVAAGSKIFDKMQCAKCHGAKGKGDGPSAATLKDEDGFPLRPYDFTRGGRMKGGSSPADVYRTFTTGLDGTPMPSYADQLSEDERWNLAYFVLSLSAGAKPVPETVTRVSVAKATSLPKTADAAEWGSVAEATVAMRQMWTPREGAETLSVRAVTDGKELSLLLEWEDPTADVRSLRAEQFTDGVAVQFPVGDGKKPFFGMGEKGQPVNIWHWRADWQLDTTGPRGDVETAHPAMHVDSYPMKDEVFLTGAGAKNPMSDQAVRKSPVAELNATALGTLTAQPANQQQANGAGAWVQGKWRVVIWRPLSTKQPNDAQLGGKKSVPVAFAVWNGSEGDRNGQKRVSFWLDLDFATNVAAGGK